MFAFIRFQIGDSSLIELYLYRNFFDKAAAKAAALPGIQPATVLEELSHVKMGSLRALQRLLEDHLYPLSLYLLYAPRLRMPVATCPTAFFMHSFLHDGRWQQAKKKAFGSLPFLLGQAIAQQYKVSITERCYQQGFTKLHPQDLLLLYWQDVSAIDALLEAGCTAVTKSGSQDEPAPLFFLLGAQPTPVDAALFGALDMALYAQPPIAGVTVSA